MLFTGETLVMKGTEEMTGNCVKAEKIRVDGVVSELFVQPLVNPNISAHISDIYVLSYPYVG